MSDRVAHTRSRSGTAARRLAAARRLSTCVLAAAVCWAGGLRAADGIGEDVREQLLQLKQLCDEGVVDAEVCKEKQRQILDLPARTPGSPFGEAEKTPEVGRGFLAIAVDSAPGTRGAAVARVLEGGPAEQAGVREGDVLLELGGQAVADVYTFEALEADLAPGAKTTLTVSRQPDEELTLEIAAVDRRRYPPAHTHRSALGFDVDLPAGWTAVQPADYRAMLQALGDQLGGDQQKAIVSEVVKTMTSLIDVFARDRSSVKVAKHERALPATDRAARHFCAKLAVQGARKAQIDYRPLHNCRLRPIEDVVAFCMDQASASDDEALRHCWVKGPEKENVQLTLAYKEQSAADDLNDLDKMIAGIAWR